MAAFLDVCRFNPTLGGTTDWTFSSAVTGYQGPTAAGAVNGATYRYRAESADLLQWEIGYGAYNSGTGVFSRSTVLFNSASTTVKINFSTVPQVAIVALAEDLLVPRSFLAGLTLSTAGSSATFGVAVGLAADSTNVDMLSLASAFTKTTGAWALGTTAGSLDTGAIANSTWYHAFLIKRPDTGVIDVLTSLSATAPTLPVNYTLFRRIGSMKTNGSAQWTKFIQDGDSFTWDIPVADVNVTNPGTAAVTRTLTLPTGVRVKALLSVGGTVLASDPGPNAIYISDLSVSDQAAAQGGAVSFQVTQPASATQAVMGQVSVMTNTAAQVRSRVQSSTANVVLVMNTNGWVDRLGRDA